MKQEIKAFLEKITGEEAEVSVPEVEVFGHYSTNLALKISKRQGKTPAEVAEKIKSIIEKESPEFLEKVEIKNGFLNFWVKPEAVIKKFEQISKDIDSFGRSKAGEGKEVIVEYSQPNIAKQMHTGHLRNTILGEAIARIHENLGWKVTRWNWIGDWGTQFGILISAYKKWGGEVDFTENPIEKLEALYVRFNEEMERAPELKDLGREEFKKLENGDPENRELWEHFKELSLKEINEIYSVLDVRFDTYIGEAFFEKDMQPLVQKLLDSGIAERSEGAVIVRLDEEKLPVALIQKSDGASLYLARDIATLEYREKEYHPTKILYVVGNEQTLEFEQLFAVAGKMGIAKKIEKEHVKYGLLLGEDKKKMSTRRGTAISIRGLMDEAVRRARIIVNEKNSELSDEEKEKVAEAIGIGALKYFLLRENRFSDIVFSWEAMLDMKGDSAPYIQYAYARLRSIERKAGKIGKYDLSNLGEEELKIARKIFEFPDKIKEAEKNYASNLITGYIYELANLLNRFYETRPILKEEDENKKNAYLMLINSGAQILKKGLGILGITVLEEI